MTIHDLVQGFARNLKSLKAKDYKESSLRLQYLDPFWKLLGWDVANDGQVPPQDVDVLIEPSMDSSEDDGVRSREPDYLFRINGFPRFIVEAKKPAVDIDADRKAIFQAKRYAWNSSIPFAILTDFEQFRLYDTTLMPVMTEPGRGLVTDWRLNFEDYPGVWEELVATFGRDAVANQSLEKLRARIRPVGPGRRLRGVEKSLFPRKGDEPVDRVFLDHLNAYRKRFAKAVYDGNPKAFPDADTLHGAARLTANVQRIIDRFVFIRACEDRGVTDSDGLQKLLDRISREGGDLYPALTAEFRDLDRVYNGYLFKYHECEDLKLPDHLLADFIGSLYGPRGPWDFRKIGDDILGVVYERFLGDVVTVRGSDVVVEQKPEVRHAGGVYYTPKFVVDTIIRRVIGPQIEGKAPADVLDVKVLDPACGSGSFLVAAYQYLVDHCVAAITANPELAKVPATPKARKKKKEIAFKDALGSWHLAPDFRAALLTHCLHGVDIDQQAVEVTIMSLYLKMLEGVLPKNWQKDWVENQLLPPMDSNICCGNSLIDEHDFDDWDRAVRSGLFRETDDDRFRINRFDWRSRNRGFGRYLDKDAEKARGRAGFDGIIGNPPYIRVQELKSWAPDECEFYKWKYDSAKKGNYDIYVVFTEKCLGLLAPDGLLGFIMPHKFWQAQYGAGLRKIIADGGHLRSVVDFGHQQVFEGASTYTAVHVLGKTSKTKQLSVARIDTLDDDVRSDPAYDTKSNAAVQFFKTNHPAGEAPWHFLPAKKATYLAKLRDATDQSMKSVTARMAQGIRTSMNTVFVLQSDENRQGFYHSEHLGRSVKIEKRVLKPFLSASNMRRYVITASNQWLLLPYDLSQDEDGVLLSEKQMRADCPLAWSYLKDCEQELRARESGKMDRDGWHGYIYQKNLSQLDKKKILVPDIVDGPTFSMDVNGTLSFVSGYGITLGKAFAKYYEYCLGLLNSKPLGNYLKSVSTPLRGGWYRPFPQFIEQLPIKLPATAAEHSLADRITDAVKKIMANKVRLRDEPLADRMRGILEREVEHLEARIDEAVYTLYGVDGLPE